ncbi:hypothetical protein B0H67DRAFT_593436 [Lasiosphaeris hirsuta]|uniref:Secreted protein n=1 Tax=Lasiosphaeris hirsuta TaxID=260670 RepID=A0AA39ZX42_9PEZI|nr:hypothetical protein B0H67DRAFT_593436 [Lasiosphaeris hirsuta]
MFFLGILFPFAPFFASQGFEVHSISIGSNLKVASINELCPMKQNAQTSIRSMLPFRLTLLSSSSRPCRGGRDRVSDGPVLLAPPPPFLLPSCQWLCGRD